MLSLSRNCHITVMTGTHCCLSLSPPYRGDRHGTGDTKKMTATACVRPHAPVHHHDVARHRFPEFIAKEIGNGPPIL